jgi:isoquinoline 1-oxidoreductase/isoquinoline 1-oxidoreductase beta subunit
MQRRTFLQLVGLAGGGLMLGVGPGGCASVQVRHMEAMARDGVGFSPNTFLTITPDDRVLLAMNKSEFGQGVSTGMATMVAEELEVPLEKVEAMHVSTIPGTPASEAGAGANTSGADALQVTGGSTSTAENFVPLRQAAAAAREMLVAAAAASWGVAASECVAAAGVVSHPSGKSARYGELAIAAAQVDMVAEPRLKEPGEFKVIGKRQRRVDAYDKSTGRAVYGLDVPIEGKLSAHVVRPPRLGAGVRSFDARAARGMKGVVDVFAFERGVAVVAEKYWQARAAARTITVEWQGGDLGGLNTDDVMAAALERAKSPGDHLVHGGDAAGALAADGVTRVEAEYTFPYLAHAPMEPNNCTVQLVDGGVNIWVPNQSPQVMAGAASQFLGIPIEKVRVESPLLGGGFGRRGVPDAVVEACAIAKRLGSERPVQVVWTREDDTRLGYFRPLGVARVRGGVDASGAIAGLEVHVVAQSITEDVSSFLGAAFPSWMPMIMQRLLIRTTGGLMSSGTVRDIFSTEGLSEVPYALSNYRLETTPIESKVPVAFWRSVGHSFTGFVFETFLDRLAHAASKDPVAYRRGLLSDSPRHLAVLNAAVAASRWGEPIEEGWGRGVALVESFGTVVAQVVEAGIVDDEIRVRHVACAADCGTVVNPDMVHAQLEGGIVFGMSMMRQRVDVVDGAIQQGNFDDFPPLRMYETPEIEITMIDSDAPPSGIGEPGLPPINPAIANAIFAATGVRLDRMPLQDAWKEAKR